MPTTKSDGPLVFDITNDDRHMLILRDGSGKTRVCGATVPELFSGFVKARLTCSKLPPMFASAMLSYIRRIPVTIGSSDMTYLSTLYSELREVGQEQLQFADQFNVDEADNA